jgi:peptidoglycan/LPS O-acetylase OafA/YrhL
MSTVERVFGQSFGSFGVFIFFALSGMLMAIQARKLADRPSLFLAHRVVRIFPIFWLACFLRVAVAWGIGLGAQFDPLALTLAPIGDIDYVLGIEWTLVYEVVFYFYVFAIIALRMSRWIEVIAGLWLVAIFANTIIHPGFAPQYPSLLTLPLSTVCAPFALGMLIPLLVRKKLVTHASLAAGAFLFALAQIQFVAQFANLIMGLGCALIVAWAAALADDGPMSSPRLAKVGDWSFAIYLVHVPVLTTLYQILPVGMNPIWVWATSLAAALLAGAALGVLDIYTYQHLKTFVDAIKPRRAKFAPAVFASFFGIAIPLAHPSATVPEAESAGASIDDAAIKKAFAKAGITPTDNILGGVDLILKGRSGLVASGWVNDPSRVGNGARILLVGGEGAPAIIFPKSYRGDVIGAYGIRGFIAPVAFRQTIPESACPPGATVRAIGIGGSGKSYRILNTTKCP